MTIARSGMRLVLGACGVIAFAGVGSAAEHWVAISGVDSSACGTQQSPCRSISQAINNAASGDTVMVGPGFYGDVNGDGNYTGPGDEHAGTLNHNATCIICINKPIHVYSTAGAASTLIASDPSSIYTTTVLIQSDGVDFGSAGHGFTLIGGNEVGINLDLTVFYAVQNMSVAGNVDVGDRNGYLLTGYPYLSHCPPGDCIYTARVLIEGNQAINNQAGFSLTSNFANGPGLLVVKDNLSIGAGLGFYMAAGTIGEGGIFAIPAGNVQLLNNIAAGGTAGFAASSIGPIQFNTALENSQAGFNLTPGGYSFINNSAIANGGPGVVVNYVADEFTVTSLTFTPFAENNFVGNDRKAAHCGVQNVGGILSTSPPPASTPLAAADSYWGSPNGPSPTGAGDAVGGACDLNNGVTSAPQFSKTPFPISANP